MKRDDIEAAALTFNVRVNSRIVGAFRSYDLAEEMAYTTLRSSGIHTVEVGDENDKSLLVLTAS